VSGQGALAALAERSAMALSSESVSVAELVTLAGEEGLVLLCVLLALPLLLPIGIPGTSPAFSILLAAVAVGVLRDRPPWLPRRLLAARMPSAPVRRALARAARLAHGLESRLRPRWGAFARSAVLHRLNGLMLLLMALLFCTPLPLVPFANTLPAAAVIVLGLGMAEHDGPVLLVGHALGLAAATYIGWLLVAALGAGAGLVSRLGF
jgi:hypothetical protein